MDGMKRAENKVGDYRNKNMSKLILDCTGIMISNDVICAV